MTREFSADNRDVAPFLVTKVSWKGRYKRIFSIGTLAISTYNPDTLEVTNQWLYEDFIGITPVPKPNSSDEFCINYYKKNRNVDKMRFVSECTQDILTEVLSFQSKFAPETVRNFLRVNAYKPSRLDSDQRIQLILQVTACALEQIDSRKIVVSTYLFKDIRQIIKVSDYPGGFVVEVGEQRRRHMFASQECDRLIQEIRRNAGENIGIHIDVAKNTITRDDFEQTRWGLYSRDEQLISYVDFRLYKQSVRYEQPVLRLLCLSENCIVERDGRTYATISVRPLKHVVCLSRDPKNVQQFSIEYDNGTLRTYQSNERDLVLASLVDGAKAAGNQQVHITSCKFSRHLRLLPMKLQLERETEGQCMRHVVNPPPGLRRFDLIRRFNSNIPYNGTTHLATERQTVDCLEAVLSETYSHAEGDLILRCESQLQALHRLFGSKYGFQSFTSVAGIRQRLGTVVVSMLKIGNESLDYALVEMLNALLQPLHADYELRHEQSNKLSLLSSNDFVEYLLDLVVKHVERGTGFLVIASVLDFLTFAVCAPFSETTEGKTFDRVLEAVASKGRTFYKLFQNPSMTIVKGAGLVMRAIIEESTVDISKSMQLLSLTEGAFLRHLQMALLVTGHDLRYLANRQLSGQLISLWIADNDAAKDLLRRSLPRGLLDFLDSNEKAPNSESDFLLSRNNLEVATAESKQSKIMEQVHSMQYTLEAKLDSVLQHWNLDHKLTFLQRRFDDRNQQQQQRPVVLRKARKRVKSNVNWRMFAHQFGKDHSKADLLWNAKTREEFRLSIENELRQLTAESDLAVTETPISWNHTEFIAQYPSLCDEIKVGDYFLRHLLNETEANATPIHDARQFFNDVYHRFLLTSKSEMRCLCLKAMAITYGRHNITIGQFSDTRDIVAMLQRTTNITERDHFVLLLSKLALNKENVREMINGGAVPLLVDLASLAHLHVARATLQNQSNVIDYDRNADSEGSSEWHYYDKKGEKQGPVTLGKMKEMYESQEIFEKTEVWAEGLGQWVSLSSVPQFRWTICGRSNALPVYNPTELCTLILDMFIQMTEFYPSRDQNDCVIRPLPAVKRILSDSLYLFPVVQLLLTYDPAVVHRVARLLYLVMQDNPYISRLYMSGLFYFILMYNGSDVLPVARLLHYTHNKQSFRSPTANSELIARSILSPLLPEAAIFYLEQYGVEKYAEVYLGEFDNPEIIWNNEMRRYLIGQVALHVADFSGRLSSNIKAIYRYCPIAPIKYEQLKDELFCHVYYLRHLCDTQKFPDWPIRDPVPFLRDCLAAWNDEMNTKPPEMSVEEACTVLGISVNDNEWRDASKLRKAYFNMSRLYHPDKRADGLEMFQKINVAHEILSTAQGVPGAGLLPNVQRIVICLRAQSIVYSRHSEELSPFKYAGYQQLIKTIDLEAKDNALFRDGGGELLSASVELCAYTLASSSLNAEQLRRDNGLEALLTAFERCQPMVNLSSKETDMCVRVCIEVCRCFSIAAHFEGSRERISGMKTLFPALCCLLKYEKLGLLASAAAECICSLSVCTLLQTQLFQSGVLWQLVPHLFRYDYTLDEGGVEHSEKTNQQAVWNRLARGSCEALASLAGYREHTPDNDGVQNSLRAMLSPYVCRLMREGNNNKVLKILNSNTEDPYIIWDNATRSELMEFVDRHRENPGLTSELFGAEFQMTAHKNEFVIGDVFVRIYNEQPHFKLFEGKQFCVDLLDFLRQNEASILGKKTNGVTPNEEEMLIDWGVVGDGSGMLSLPKRVEMSLEALNNTIRADNSNTYLLIGQFGLIFSYLQAFTYPKIQKTVLEVIYHSAENGDCLTDIACSKNDKADGRVKLPLLLPLIEKIPEVTERVLHTLGALASNGTIAKELLECGGLLYILGVYTDVHGKMKTSAAPEAGRNRVTAAELLSKLQSDNQSGPRWNRFISRFLPPIFADGLRDSPQAAVAMFDADNENPELIWNDAIRGNVRSVIQNMLSSLVQAQLIDPKAKWNDNLIKDCPYGSIFAGEVVVGGIFLRLFNSNPTWAVRHPKQFTTELMERVLELMQKPNDQIEITTTALVNLIANHPTTADQLPAQGYLPQFSAAMIVKNSASSKSALLIVEQLAGNTYCTEALARLPVIRGINVCMQNQPAYTREAAHALKLLFKHSSSDLSEQMLSSGIIPHLLNVLGSHHLEGVANLAAAKAEIVEALKSAALDLQYGDKISSLLNESAIWKDYKDQRHDLYLPAARTQAITGPSGTGLALTFSDGQAGHTDGMFAPPPRPVPPPKPNMNDR